MPFFEDLAPIARWESTKKKADGTAKYWVDLWFDNGFYYRSPDGEKPLECRTRDEAIAEIERRIYRGDFQPAANKKPLRRI